MYLVILWLCVWEFYQIGIRATISGMAKKLEERMGTIEERVEEVQSELMKEMDSVKADLGAILSKMSIMQRMKQMLSKLDGEESGELS